MPPAPGIAIVFNPTARGDRARRLHTRLTALGSHVRLFPTQGPGDARQQARDAATTGATTIVAAGGDGTVNEVVNGILDAPAGTPAPRLGILPVGTVNVFARELRLPTRLEQAWNVILQNSEVAVDIPEARFNGPSGSMVRRWIQLAGAGLDSRAVERVAWPLKQRLGALAYAWAGVQALQTPMPRLTVETDRGQASGETVLLGNGRYFGGHWPALPHARLDDRRIDVAVIDRASWPRLLRAGWHLLWNRFDRCPGVTHLQAESIRIRASAPLDFQLDGELAGPLPAEFVITGAQLRVAAPAPVPAR